MTIAATRANGSAHAQVRVFMCLAFAASWGLGGAGLLIDRAFPGARALSTSSPLYYMAAYAISLVGIGLTAHYAGRSGLHGLVRRLVPGGSDVWAYLVVPIGYFAMAGIAIAISGDGSAVARAPWIATVSLMPLTIVRDPGPIGEEFGWRGFALPRLLERFSPLHASLRLGLMHLLWHAPLFLIGGMPQAQLFFPTFAIGVIAIAIIDTFLYLRTVSNLLLAIVVHLLANVCGGIAKDARALDAFFVLEGLVALAIVAFGGLTPQTREP
jgi:uncharacterized protein